MTYPEGRQPLRADDMAKMHPSRWEDECAALREQNTELALQVLASCGQAEEAYQAQLSAESAASWANIKAEQAITEAKALRAENERLRTFVSMYDDLREGIRELGVKRKPQIYLTILAMDAARVGLRTTALQKQEGE